MNRTEAKAILMRYRLGVDDRADPEISEALALAERDAELKRWLEQQAAFHRAAQGALREIPAPDELMHRILAERVTVKLLWNRRGLLLAAASIALLLSLATWWLMPPREAQSFAAFTARMVRFALREYRMDILTNDPAAVRQFLAQRGAPADYMLARGLEALPVKGGGQLSWQGNPVAMVCFGLPQNETAYLFVMDRAAVREGALPGSDPEIAGMNRLATAAWSRGNRVYVLAAPTDAETMKKLLN